MIISYYMISYYYDETTRILSVGSNPNKMLLKISKISRAKIYLELNFTFSETIFSYPYVNLISLFLLSNITNKIIELEWILFVQRCKWISNNQMLTITSSMISMIVRIWVTIHTTCQWNDNDNTRTNTSELHCDVSSFRMIFHL